MNSQSINLNKDSSATNVNPTKYRWFLMLLVFIISLIAYLDRVNYSVCAPGIMGEFNIDKVQFGMGMSAFVLAYTIMQIPGGLLSERYGIRIIGAICMVFWSIFTILVPLAGGFIMLLVIRFLFGIGEGPLVPNNGVFLTKWFSPKEKAIASTVMLAGLFIGPAIGPPLSVWIMGNWDWHMVFYAYGVLGLIIAPIWYYYSRDIPSQHPSVNIAELNIITDNGTVMPTQKTIAPWRHFLKSVRFWCLGYQYFVVNYFLYIFLTWIPLYLLEARGMSMTGMGWGAAAPWLTLCVMLLICGRISDALVRHGRSKFASRSILALLGFAGCGFSFLMAAGAESPAENIFWLSASFGSLGATYTGAWAACQDMGQRYAGSVIAWMNTWANLGGVCAPIVTAVLVNNFGWQAAFYLSTILIGTGIICWFIIRPDHALISATGESIGRGRSGNTTAA